MFYILYFLFYIPLRLIFPTRVIGKEKVKKGKLIIICNHRSNVDPILLLLLLPRRLAFMAKKELFSNKFKSWFFRKFGAYPIDRAGVDISAIKNTLYLLKKGNAVVIFPEGTRNKDDENEDMLKLKSGAAMLSIKSDSPILPVYFQKKIRAFRFNRLYVGDEFLLNEFKNEKLTQEVLDNAAMVIRNQLEELKEKANG